MHVCLWIAIDRVGNILPGHRCSLWFIYYKLPGYITRICYHTIFCSACHWFGNRDFVINILIICICFLFFFLSINNNTCCVFLIVYRHSTICRYLTVIYFCSICDGNNLIMNHISYCILKTVSWRSNILTEIISFIWCNWFDFLEFEDFSRKRISYLHLLVCALRCYFNSICKFIFIGIIIRMSFIYRHTTAIIYMKCLVCTGSEFDFLSIFICIKFRTNFYPEMNISRTCQIWIIIVQLYN